MLFIYGVFAPLLMDKAGLSVYSASCCAPELPQVRAKLAAL
jgi:hypothetical protein